MKLSRIILIVGLMTIALVGIVVLQTRWIKWSIKLKEEQFDKSVFAALTKISDRLAQDEYDDIYSRTLEQITRNSKGLNNEIIIPIQKTITTTAINNGDKFLISKESITSEAHNYFCNCRQCIENKSRDAAEQLRVRRMLSAYPLTERIALDHLNIIVKEELSNQGIDIECTYGIFENTKKNFVIIKDHYVIDDEGDFSFEGGNDKLLTSKYRTGLFTYNSKSPGVLMLYFPSMAKLLWSTVWNNIIASLLFIGIIMLTFGYTIYVIFRQKKLSEMKSDFINNMTHEFKTPIATISLATDSIISPMIIESQDKVRRFVNIIKQENTRMHNQVERVLQMALLDRDNFTLQISEIDIHQIAQQVAEHSRLKVEQLGGIFKTKFYAEDSIIEGDSTHITNIIYNLIDNAIKYSPNKLDIELETKSDTNGVYISVRDKGQGMTAEQRKHIFDKFYRAHTGNLHDVKGFGLGLSYVRKIIAAHHGKVNVESSLGKGSLFTIFLPYRYNKN